MKTLLRLFFFLHLTIYSAADQIEGFWQTIDKKTNKPSSIIAIYPYEGFYYGRLIGTYNKDGVLDDTIYQPKDKAPGIKNNPYYCGIDILWHMKPTSSNKYKGTITNPKTGKTYNAEIWREGENLIIRGKVFIFGKNITWPPFPEKDFSENFKKPDLATFIPKKPET